MSPAPETSEARLAANRENARRSTGPKTAEGKFKVRLNGLQHGLTGNTVLMPNEDPAQYEAFITGIAETLKPEGSAEHALARSIADGYWRLNRARAIESNIFALGALASPDGDGGLTEAQTFLENARQFSLLTLYEGRIDRTVRKNLAQLDSLQTARRAACEKALEEAALLRRLNPENKEEPEPNGFGFSNDFLDRHIDRQNRLAEARRLFAAPRARAKSDLRRAA